MYLFTVVALVMAVAAVSALTLSGVAAQRVPSNYRTIWVSNRTALLVVLLLVALLAVRSRDFGVDTPAYLRRFQQFCDQDTLARLTDEFNYAAIVLNTTMLGACSVTFLPAAWAVFIAIGPMIANARLADKVRYVAVLLFSVVGIELSTNALRQGLSQVFLLAAYSYWPRRRIVAGLLAGIALLLHASAALAIAAVAFAKAPRIVFVVGLTLACIALFGSGIAGYQTDFGISAIGRFLYEVRKYKEHEGSELAVRLLVSGSLVALVLSPFVVAYGARRDILKDPGYGFALKLALTALPFVTLPFFGYRFIYGIFPIVLWSILSLRLQDPRFTGRVFLLNLFLGGGWLLVWALGSRYMRSIPLI